MMRRLTRLRVPGIYFFITVTAQTKTRKKTRKNTEKRIARGSKTKTNASCARCVIFLPKNDRQGRAEDFRRGTKYIYVSRTYYIAVNFSAESYDTTAESCIRYVPVHVIGWLLFVVWFVGLLLWYLSYRYRSHPMISYISYHIYTGAKPSRREAATRNCFR